MIVTFYSFKGGVGRSMLAVETAAQLARRGRSVIVWDLDLEAPGIQKIPKLAEIDALCAKGTLDMLLDLQGAQESEAADYQGPERALRDSILDLADGRIAKAGGRLSFLLPGKLDDSYGARYAALDWARLFQPEKGPGIDFFFRVAQLLTEDLGYDYLVIDSRTGYTDVGSLCAVHLPDLVVLVYTLGDQNLSGLERVVNAVTRRQAADRSLRVYRVANKVPGDPRLKNAVSRRMSEFGSRNLEPHLVVPLRPEWLLGDAVPSLERGAGAAAMPELTRLADELERTREELIAAAEREIQERRVRRLGREREDEPGALRRRELFERAKRFEEQVADLFRLLGYQATVGYTQKAMQFDIRLEMPGAAIPQDALVECKDTDRPVGQREVREFAAKVASAREGDRRSYQAIMVARSRFADNAHAEAAGAFVQLRTHDDLMRLLVDLGPSLDACIRGYEGTELERLYVEQELVFQGEVEPGRKPPAYPASQAVLDWLDRPGENLLALLGDFGSGKTSLCKHLGHLLARRALEKREGARLPVVIDLGQARSAAVSLENILANHFQSLTSRPINPSALLHLNRAGQLLLIFDGFDEVVGYLEPLQFAESLRQILRAAEGRAKVLLTCRTNFFRDRPQEVSELRGPSGLISTPGATRLYEEIRDRPEAQIAYLLEFSESQVEQYLERALPPPADWQAFRRQIRDTYNLDDLARRPFLLDMIVTTLPGVLAGARGREVNVADLYEAYSARWFDHAAGQLGIVRRYAEDLLAHLARFIWDSPDGRVHYQVLADKAREFLGSHLPPGISLERLDAAVRSATFLNRDAGGYYSFIHRSFLEFFVARTIREGIARNDPATLHLRRLAPEIAHFLQHWPEAGRTPELAASVLSASYQPRVSENALLLLYWQARSRFGPLVQASSGAHGSEAMNLDELRQAFRSSRPEALQLQGAELVGANLDGIDLAGDDLSGADLAGASLRGAGLERAKLAGAKLSLADISGARLIGADLSGAEADHLMARGARFGDADLSKAKLSFGIFTGANFDGASLAGAALRGAGFLRASLPLAMLGPLDSTVGAIEPTEVTATLQLGHEGSVACVAWSADGFVLASSGTDGTVKLWDPASGKLLRTLAGHRDRVWSTAWDARGERLGSGGDDGTVKVWHAASGKLLRTLEGHRASVWSVAWDPCSERLASGGVDGTVKVWDAASGKLLRTLEGHRGWVWSTAWDPRGERLASGGDGGTVKLWDAATGKPLRILDGHRDRVWSVAWDALGERLASGGDDGTVKLWDAATGRLLRTLEGLQGPVRSVAWDPRGERLASSGDDGTAKVWDAATGKLLRALEGQRGPGRSVAWDARGERLGSGGDDGTVKLWEAATGKLLRSLEGHEHGVLSVAWEARGERLASGGDDGRISIFDPAADSARPLGVLYHLGKGLASSGDGRYWSGDPETLELVRFVDGWALYGLEDFPDRLSPERVAEALAGAASSTHGSAGGDPSPRRSAPRRRRGSARRHQ